MNITNVTSPDLALEVGLLPIGISEAKQSIKAYVAPRVVLIEKISDLVK